MAKNLADSLKYLALNVFALGCSFDNQSGISHGFITSNRFNTRKQGVCRVLAHFLFGDQAGQGFGNTGFAFLCFGKIKIG